MSEIKNIQDLKGQTIKLKEWAIGDHKRHLVNRVDVKHSNTVVFTNFRTLNIQNSNVQDFLDTIEVVDAVLSFTPDAERVEKSVVSAEQKKMRETLSFFEPTEAQKEVQNALLTMLGKVMEDGTAIPQAKSVCDIANTMVNMEKSQIQLMQLARSKR